MTQAVVLLNMDEIFLGAEYPPGGQPLNKRAWATLERLAPKFIKFRSGTPMADVLTGVSICYTHTTTPMVVFRSVTEIPDLKALTEEFEPYHYALSDLGGIQFAVELANEPNHTNTRFQLGNTLAEQVNEYRRRLRLLIDGMRKAYPDVKLIAPGLMPEGRAMMQAWATPERAECDFDGVHIYGTGANGLQLPNGFQGMPFVTEINANEAVTDPARRQAATLEMMEIAHGYGCRRFCYFILPWGEDPKEMSEWEIFALTVEQAEAYAAWAKTKDDGGVPVPDDQIKAWLIDMWRRQGAEPNTATDAFFAYALQVAETTGRAIIPMLSKDGNYLNYSDPTRIVAYTIPPMWALKSGGPVQEGLPPKVA